MAKDPAVLFYTSDFLTGTSFFTDEQKGQYITLLCQQHQNGHIPEYHMIAICKSHDSPVIKKFMKDEKGLYYNDRMEQEKLRRVSYCKSRSNNLSGRKKKESYDNHMETHMETETETITKDINIKKKTKNIDPKTLRKIIIVLRKMNIILKKTYQLDKDTHHGCIKRILKDYTLKQIFQTIRCKRNEWKHTEQEKFLRPETIFSNKFESYYQQSLKTNSEPF